LTDKLSGFFGYIGFSLGGFDICEGPLITLLGSKFETQDTILS
jgi:hypothetical protein